MTPFRAKACREGQKGNLRITIPLNIVQQLRATGFNPPGWVRLHIEDAAPVFVVARFPPSRPSVTCTLPIWAFPDLKPHDEITARAEDAVPYRARRGAGELDWLPLVDDAYLATDDGDDLVLHSRYEEPFRLRRCPPADPFWWMLGLYQAEGSKSDNAPDWTIANGNEALLAAVPPGLEAFGIPRDRQYMEVLHAFGQAPEEAEKKFERVGVRRAATRLRTGKGRAAAVLHVKKSQPLLRLFKAKLAQVFAPGWKWPSKEAARDYALGWLDGDGTITVTPSSVELRLAGGEDEHRIVKTALNAAFGWGHDKGGDWSHKTYVSPITLRGLEMLNLLDAGAFGFSMSRARLLIAFGDRVAKLYAGIRRGAHRRWGLTDHDGMLTRAGEEACRGYTRYEHEVEKARQLKTTAPHLFGVKGASLPDVLQNRKL